MADITLQTLDDKINRILEALHVTPPSTERWNPVDVEA